MGDIAKKRETILVIDDQKQVLRATVQMLEHSGYEGLEAADGEQGLTLFMLERQRIDLVLLDLLMPLRDGRQVLEDMLAIDPQAKVVIYTGYEGTENIAYPGAAGVIKKPVGIDELAQAVRRILDA